MRYLSLLLLILLTGSELIKAANIRGKVLDQGNSPIEFVNAMLLQSTDSSLVKGAISDASGAFEFEQVSAGKYLLLLSQIGYEKKYSGPHTISSEAQNLQIPALVLDSRQIQLKAAEVTAMRPFIERQVDKTVLNVENSIVDAGSTALEILKRAPGVTVDNEGNISIKGKQGVQVMIDGKPTYLSASDLYNRLRNMTSDELAQIEIITNPGSRYDAAGNSGILNLKLRKRQQAGFNGSLSSSYGQGVYPDYGLGTNLNYRKGKWNLFGNYHHSYGFYFEETELDRRFKETDYQSHFLQYIFDKGRYINNNFRTGADYYLSDKHVLGFQFRGYHSLGRDRNTSTTEIYNRSLSPDSSYVTNNQNESKWSNLSLGLNYQFKIDTTGRELFVDVDAGKYSNRSDFVFTTNHYYTDDSFSRERELATNDQPADIKILSAKMDYVHPLSKSLKFESGWKSSLVETDNDVMYLNYYNGIGVRDTGKSNHFIYKENINAVYFSGRWQGEKFGVQAGLRAEQTIADGKQEVNSETFKRDYVQLFPSLFLSYKFTDNHESRFSLSRRIDRPAYQQLNPFRYFLDPYNYNEGNPSLEPQLTWSFEAGHTFYKLVTLTLNYSRTTDAMTQITYQIDSTRTTYVRTENLSTNENYGAGISVPVQIFKWWYSSNNLNVFNNRFTGVTSAGAIDKELLSATINTYNSFSISKTWSAELQGYYQSRMVWGTWLVEPRFSVGGGVRKTLMSDRLQIRVNLNDIFHTEIIKSHVDYQNVDADFKRTFDSQFFRLHLTYNFGNRSMAMKRQRAAGSSDEENRIQMGR